MKTKPKCTILKQTGRLASVRKPWQLIRDALKDLTLQEKTKGVKVDMGVWHNQLWVKEKPMCHQCLAGCTLSRRCKVPLEQDVCLGALPPRICAIIGAIDDFRDGCIQYAYNRLGILVPKGVPSAVNIPQYHKNPAEFKKALRALATRLRAAHHGKPATVFRASDYHKPYDE